MDKTSVTTHCSGPKARPELHTRRRDTARYCDDIDWMSESLEDVLEEDDKTRTLSLRERLENWGSD